MSSEAFRRERDLFERAFELPAEERTAFLERACPDEPDLRARVAALLASEVDDAELLQPVSRVARELAPAGAVPDRVGGHLLLRELGRGGMGIVYLALQEDPRREVALKVLREGASAAVEERFRDEARVLARLHHAGIAQVYRAGVDGDRPWIAMEHVDGPPLLEHARALDRRSRLELLVEVADAIQHAHERGVVHRDLKPENVRVTADGRPKVLDFGIARVVAATSVDEWRKTREGEVLGTLAYLAPEQLAGDPDAVDARTDVHALGLLLHELVTGRPALEPRGRNLAEVQVELVVREIPPLGQLDPPSRGDLEAVAARAVERDPARRYPSARAFARDLRRYLAGEQVEARAGGRLRRLVRRVLRQRALLAGSLLALAGLVLAATRGQGAPLLALAAGIATLAVGLVRAERARRRAERESARARSMLAFLDDMLAAPDPARQGSDARLLDAIERAAQDLDERFAGEPGIEATLRRTLGATYRALGRYDEARAQLSRSAELSRRARPADSLGRATSLGWLAIANREQGRYAEAERLWREVIDLRTVELGPEHARTLDACGQLALVLHARGERGEALELSRRAVAGLRRALGPGARETCVASGNLGAMLLQEGALEEAEPLLRECADGFRRLARGDQPDTLVADHNLAVVLGELGHREEALERALVCLERHRRSFGAEHRGTNLIAVTAACLLADLGRDAEARRLLVPATRHLRSVLERAHVGRVTGAVVLAELRLSRGLPAAARGLARRAELDLLPQLSRTHRVRRRIAALRRALGEDAGPAAG